MSQYKIGTASVTNGSQVVTGTGTSWLAEITAGDEFTLPGSGIWYTVGSIDSDNQITLNAAYTGATAADQSYTIVRDFTDSGIPYPEPGDIDTAAIFKRAMFLLQTLLDAGGAGGDMLASVYDPDAVAGDAFDRTNHSGAQAIATITGLQAALDLLAPLVSAALTGTPTAPTATEGTDTTQLATTAFVQAAVAALVNASPAALDTLNELAAALGDDANFSTTMTNALAGKQDYDADTAKTDVEQTFSAKQSFGAAVHEKINAIAASNIDVALGSLYTKTITGATTFTVSNVPATGSVASFILDLTNGGSSTITWWAGVKWAGGTAPTLTAAGRDAIGFYTHDGGTTWTGLLLGLDLQ